jgi:hypothetical protein
MIAYSNKRRVNMDIKQIELTIAIKRALREWIYIQLSNAHELMNEYKEGGQDLHSMREYGKCEAYRNLLYKLED